MRSTTRLGEAFEHASAHHDLLPTHVLRAAGLSPKQIAELVDDRILERVIRGLYRRAGTRSPIQDIAAALQRHPGAVASHTSALYLHGVDIAPPRLPHLTLPPGSSSGNRLGVLHRSPVERIDRTRRQRLPVTSLPRSVVDSAELLTVEALADVVNQSVSRKAVRVSHVIEAAARVEAAPGRRGSGRLRSVLSGWCDEIEPDSVAEAAAIRRIIGFGLAAPVTQHVVKDAGGRFVARLDLAWPGEMVAREYDSIRWHRPDRIEPDEERRQHLEALGWTVEPLYRYHLLPGEVDWLHALRDQLSVARRLAS